MSAKQGRGTASNDGPSRMDALLTVLQSVRVHDARSRADVIQQTGLPRAVVFQRVEDLLAAGLLIERGFGPSRGGRPPARLEFHGDAGHVFIAVLSSMTADAALVDLSGRLVAYQKHEVEVAEGPEATLEKLFDICRDLRSGVDNAPPLFGVGIGLPGPVETGSGRPVSPRIMPGWSDFPVGERVADELGAPVWVENDVNLMALGEWREGVGQGHRDMLFVNVSIAGIGAGLISDGRLVRGAKGAAGELGHFQVTSDANVICRCGNVGCLEALASGDAIVRSAMSAGGGPVLADLGKGGSITPEMVAVAALHGDTGCLEVLQDSGRLIGTMLASIVDAFNPSLVVLGGEGVTSDIQLAAIREMVYSRSQPLATRDLVITRSQMQEKSGVVGAAWVVLDEIFAPGRLPETLARAGQFARRAA